MKTGKILLVEDEENLGAVLRNYLELSGFDVELRTDGKKGWSAFKSEKFDICILDVMMPLMDGFTLGKDIRSVNQDIPIIYLTARKQKEDIVKGYLTGADDYITKPFDSELLIHKLKALLRRSNQEVKKEKKYTISNFEFDTKYRHLIHGGQTRRLSPKESDLLMLLCEFQNDIMPRELALKKIWNEDSYFTARSMDVYITKLRKYLADDPSVEIINYHSNGYMLKTV